MNTKRLGEYFQSLAVAALVAGLLPLLLVGTLMVSLSIAQVFWPLADLSGRATEFILQVLSILGSGSPWQGVVTIGMASSLVGMLFDTYAFCSHQGLVSR